MLCALLRVERKFGPMSRTTSFTGTHKEQLGRLNRRYSFGRSFINP